MNRKPHRTKPHRGGAFGIIVLLVSLLVVGYLVYLQLQNRIGTKSLDPTGGTATPQQIIDNFKSEAQKIEGMQKKALEKIQEE